MTTQRNPYWQTSSPSLTYRQFRSNHRKSQKIEPFRPIRCGRLVPSTCKHGWRVPCRFAANLLVVHCRIYLNPTIIAVVYATFLNFIAVIAGIVAHIADVIVAMPPLNPRLNLGQFWDEMIRGMEERVASWLRLRLLQRSRLTIAKTLLVSIPVYAIQHLELNKRNQERIERVQQKLIWGDTRSRLSVAHK